MNIFFREIRMNMKSSVYYLCALCLAAFFLLSFYTIFQSDLDDFIAFLDQFPEPMKAAFAIRPELMGSVLGYYAFIYFAISIIAAVQAVGLGIGIFSKEIREKTADFLMTKPVRRPSVFAQKYAASMVILLASGLMYGIFIYLVNTLMYDDSTGKLTYLYFSLSFIIMQQVFLAIGIAVSQIFRKIKSPLPIAAGISAFFYAISAFVVSGAEDKLRFITPFQYNRPDSILENGGLELKFVFAADIVIVVCIAFAQIRFHRKDIHAV
jgi:ABC-2 type transport system permease protein